MGYTIDTPMYLRHPPFFGKPMVTTRICLLDWLVSAGQGLTTAFVCARSFALAFARLRAPALAKARCSCHWKVLAIFRDCMLQNLARKSLTHRSMKYNSVTSASATAGLSFDVLLELKAKSKWQWIGGGWIQIHVGIDECGSGMLGLLWGNAAGQFGLECQRGCLTARFCFGGPLVFGSRISQLPLP